MNWEFRLLDDSAIQEIAKWRYEPPFDVYNPKNGDGFVESTYSVYVGNELSGFRSFGIDGQVPGGDYEDETYLDTGGGLRPELTGKGLGVEWLQAGLGFGRATFEVNKFRVTIAKFNARAIKVAKRVGFYECQCFNRTSDGKAFVILLHEAPLRT